MARTKTTPRRGNKPTTVFVPRSQNTLNITDRIRDRQLKNQKVDSRVENCSDQKKKWTGGENYKREQEILLFRWCKSQTLLVIALL